MLGLSELKQTKVYQEAKQEGLEEGKQEAKLEAIPELLELGLRLEQIARALKLPLEVVQEAAQSFHKQNIAAFIQLLNTQRSLFSPQDLADLEPLIAPVPDDIKELSQAIAFWCNQEAHAPILNALHQVRHSLSAHTSNDYLFNKQTLQNAIEYS